MHMSDIATEPDGVKWRAEAMRALLTMPEEFTGEDIRRATKAKPHHPNCWGAFVLQLINQGHIEATGKYAPMRDRRSHGRSTMIYRRTA